MDARKRTVPVPRVCSELEEKIGPGQAKLMGSRTRRSNRDVSVIERSLTRNPNDHAFLLERGTLSSGRAGLLWKHLPLSSAQDRAVDLPLGGCAYPFYRPRSRCSTTYPDRKTFSAWRRMTGRPLTPSRCAPKKAPAGTLTLQCGRDTCIAERAFSPTGGS